MVKTKYRFWQKLPTISLYHFQNMLQYNKYVLEKNFPEFFPRNFFFKKTKLNEILSQARYVKVSYLAFLEELEKIKVFLSKTVFCNICNPN